MKILQNREADERMMEACHRENENHENQVLFSMIVILITYFSNLIV